jgi:hypothetical protein
LPFFHGPGFFSKHQTPYYLMVADDLAAVKRKKVCGRRLPSEGECAIDTMAANRGQGGGIRSQTNDP